MSLSPTISAAGMSVPPYAEVLAGYQSIFRGIYGSDIYIAPDSQDGQFLAALAFAQNDANMAMLAAFNSFSPTFAQGVGLSSLVKLNGLARQAASSSTAVGRVVGVIGTTITNGVVQDTNQNLWNLPPTVTVPSAGYIDVTVTAQELGNIAALSGDINTIYTPTRGWQSFASTTNAVPGAAVESDATLRARQAMATSLPALSNIESISSAVGDVSGVSRYFVYENNTGATDSDGVPAHSISVVTQGGDINAIANVVALKKPPGIQTYGSTVVTVVDSRGVPSTINLYTLAQVSIYVSLTIASMPGYVSTTAALIQQAIAQWLNSLSIGEDVLYNKLWAPANLSGDAATMATGKTQAQLDLLSNTFNITALTVDTAPSPVGTSNISILFNQAAVAAVANVVVTVV